MSMMKKSTRASLTMLVGLALPLTIACEAQVTTPEAPPAAPELDDDALRAQSPFHFDFVKPAFGDPLPGLSKTELALFTAGKAGFEEVETVADGLGPVFNGSSCAECHSVPASGGGSETLETRFGTLTAALFDPLAELGGSLIQVKGIGQAGNCNFVGETVPSQATSVSQRRTTPLFGLGLVDAVPESTFRYVARYQASNFPREAGRLAIVHDIANNRAAVGRFGWKGQVPTLRQFSGDAYLNEMGVTNPEFPNESCPQGNCDLLAACNPVPALNDDGGGVEEFLDFMTYLAPPPRGKRTTNVDTGRQKFSDAGCTHCHWSTFRTGTSASPALSGVTFHPYSDFLLHDMGSLGDGIELGGAGGNEFRTAPLWGVRVLTTFLHDGRAHTLTEAILAHDGQAQRARDRFAAFSAKDQAAVIEFLNSL
jgi:CxxC motif-containing protein (DUF1111 family)